MDQVKAKGEEDGKMKGEGEGRLMRRGRERTFRAPNHCAKFCQNRMKIAAVGAFTDRLIE